MFYMFYKTYFGFNAHSVYWMIVRLGYHSASSGK